MNSKMKSPSFSISKLFVPLVLVGWVLWSLAIAPELQAAPSIREQLQTEARKEGTIDFFAPSTLSPRGAQELVDALRKGVPR